MSSLALVFYTATYLMAFGGLLGGLVSGWLAVLALCLLAGHLLALWAAAGLPSVEHFPLWLDFPGVAGSWSLVFDHISASVLALVLLVSVLVHLYSLEYLSWEPGLFRFFSHLLFFTGFMSLMVLAAGFIPFFVGWEGIGLASYFLIGFWSSRPQAGKSALKAVFMNRPGDFCLVAAMAVAGVHLGSLDFSFLALALPYALREPLAFGVGLGDILGLLVLVAAAAKSAQFGLHGWLPDAMEGPTPVSALLHAATMVTAGVYLCLRLSPLVQALGWLQLGLILLGLLTAFLGALAGLAQFDAKRSIAYSTTANLGLMFVCCGLLQFQLALFHLVAHAFFKALLFLAAGSAIHGCGGEQDLRRLAGLYRHLPSTSSLLVLGGLFAAGCPFTSAFYSKELVAGAGLAHSAGWASGPFLGLVLGFVLLSCLYSLRPLLVLAGQGGVRGVPSPSEPGWRMLFPLVVLSFFGLLFGFYLGPWFGYPLGLGLAGLAQPVMGFGWSGQLEVSPGVVSLSAAGLLPFGLVLPWLAGLLLGGSGYRAQWPVLAVAGFGRLRFWTGQATSRLVATLGSGVQGSLAYSVERGWLEWCGPLAVSFLFRSAGRLGLVWRSGGLSMAFSLAGLAGLWSLLALFAAPLAGPASRFLLGLPPVLALAILAPGPPGPEEILPYRGRGPRAPGAGGNLTL